MMGVAAWLAVCFAIVSAGAAQRSFSISAETEPDEQWPGDPDYVLDVPAYVFERRHRERRRRAAAAWQAAATFCAAGAALEALAAPEASSFGIGVTVAGAVIAICGSGYRALEARRQYIIAGASARREAFNLKYKWGFPAGVSADEEFASREPSAAAVLARASKRLPILFEPREK